MIESDQRTGHILIRIVGASMFPLLRHGSSARVELSPIEAVRPGDLAVFKSGEDGFLCHRVFKKHHRRQEQFLKTKGDAHFCFDSFVKKESFVGRVTLVNIGSFRLSVDNVFCRLLGLGLGCLVPFILWPMDKLKQALRSLWNAA